MLYVNFSHFKGISELYFIKKIFISLNETKLGILKTNKFQ